MKSYSLKTGNKFRFKSSHVIYQVDSIYPRIRYTNLRTLESFSIGKYDEHDVIKINR